MCCIICSCFWKLIEFLSSRELQSKLQTSVCTRGVAAIVYFCMDLLQHLMCSDTYTCIYYNGLHSLFAVDKDFSKEYFGDRQKYKLLIGADRIEYCSYDKTDEVEVCSVDSSTSIIRSTTDDEEKVDTREVL